MNLAHDRVRQLLDYDAQTGAFVWKMKTCDKVVPGKPAGGFNAGGYLRLHIDKQFVYGHRLAWFYVYGEWPAGHLDHVNGNPSDNRIANLRLASQAQNNQNHPARKDSASGVRGVMRRKDTGRWRAEIRVDKRLISLGCFDSLEEAAVARKQAEHKYFTHHREVVQ